MKETSIEPFIVFEDKDYFVVSKPPVMASLDERDTSRPSVLRLAQQYCPTAQLCHRLDKETSGALAIAKNQEAYRHLSIQFEKRKVEKTYHAVVPGIVELDNRRVDYPVAVSTKGNVRIDSVEGKPSVTVFNTLKVYHAHTLVECRPVTGRMHQIRIHLAALKAPIVADVLYGGTFVYLSSLKGRKFNLKKDTEELPLMSRVALHAYSLRFTGLDGNPVSAEAPYPKDLRALVVQLEKFS